MPPQMNKLVRLVHFRNRFKAVSGGKKEVRLLYLALAGLSQATPFVLLGSMIFVSLRSVLPSKRVRATLPHIAHES